MRRLFALALLLAAMPAWPVEHYRAAEVQADGRLRLATTRGEVRWARLVGHRRMLARVT